MRIRKAKYVCVPIFLLLGAYALIIWKSTSSVANTEELGKYNATAMRPTGCSWNLIYTRPAHGAGRFGNRLMEYASAWAVAVQHNLTAVISDEIARGLGPSFDGLSVASQTEYVHRLRLAEFSCACWIQWGMDESPIAKSSAELKKLLVDQISKKTPISIRPHIILEDFIVPVRKLLRLKLHPHPTLFTYVHKTLQDVSRSLKKNPAEITFVGVHVRLTDYPRYITGGFGKNAQPVDVNYYLRATDYMIHQLQKKSASNIVFLIVSDDKNWCTSELIPSLEQLMSSKNWTGGELAVRWSGSSSYRQDFALLSSCNHSIIAYGTYGGGAALLAGGMTVVYDINRGKGGKIGGAMAFAALIPEWTLLY